MRIFLTILMFAFFVIGIVCFILMITHFKSEKYNNPTLLVLIRAYLTLCFLGIGFMIYIYLGINHDLDLIMHNIKIY